METKKKKQYKTFHYTGLLSVCFLVNPSQDCSQVIEGKMCGEDHQTYLNECDMLSRGVVFAYYGPCKEECSNDYSQVSSLSIAMCESVSTEKQCRYVKYRQDTSRRPPIKSTETLMHYIYSSILNERGDKFSFIR